VGAKVRLSLQKKIILGFGLAAIVIISSSLYTYNTLLHNYQLINRVDNIYEPSEANLHSLMQEVSTSKMLIKNWVFIDYKSNTPAKEALVDLHKIKFKSLKNRLEPLVVEWDTETQLEYYDIIALVEDSLFPMHRTVMQTLDEFEDYNNPMIKFEMMSLVQEEDDPIMLVTNRIVNRLDLMITKMGTEFANSKEEMYASLKYLRIMFIVSNLIFFGFIIVLAVLSRYIIVNPLNKLKAATKEISRGNLDTNLNINSGDELEELGEAFNLMAKNIEENQGRLRAINDQLRESEKALRESNQTKDKFLSILAHDLKAPFASLVSVSEVVANDDNKLPEQRKKNFSKSIHTTAVQLSNLIENLLLWSRTQNKRVVNEPSCVDVRESVIRTIDLVAVNIREKSIEIKNKIPQDSHVFADANILDTVLRNLLTNAVKYTYRGGKIEINLEEENEKFYRIVVRDNGIGISREDIQMLFRIDIDTKFIGTSTEKGTGLGLILVKEFVDIMGGEVSVESGVGVGSAFSFTIKRYNPQK
jgi:signal transduction histidine kinase